MNGKYMTAVAALVLSAALVGCGQPAHTAKTSSQVKANVTTNQTTTANAANTTNKTIHAGTQSYMVSARAYVKAVKAASKVSGAASLTVDKKTEVLTVALELSGVQAGKKYTAEIVDSSGKSPVYHLTAITGDKTGSGVSLTSVKKVKSFAQNWSVEVLSGTTVVAKGQVQIQR